MDINKTPKHRTAEAAFRITGKDGKALANTVLRFRQTKHEFLFGCGAFDFVAKTNAEKFGIPEDKRALIDEKIEIWKELFNYGTLPFYWGQFEPDEGSPRTAELMNAANYMKDNGIEIKGHPLCWHTACADWLMKYDNETILKKQLERIDREVSGFKGIIDKWDVINEVVIMPIFDKYDNAITRICNDLGRVGIVKEMFRRAYENNPDATFLINDFNTSTNYEILIDGCLNAGVPISAIGIQSHQHQGYWGDEKLYEVLKRFDHFGLPIHFTENTLISGDIMPAHIVDLNDWQVDEWPTTPEGEERQANEWETMMRILFENPCVEAVTGWDFTDGAWLKAPSGFITLDNRKKPAYDRLYSMIKGEWWTDTEVRTDDKGIVKVQGVRGDYLFEKDGKSAAVKLDKTSNAAKTVDICL